MRLPYVRFNKKEKIIILTGVVLVLAGIGGATRALFLGGSGGNPSATSDIELQRGLVGWWKMDGNAKDFMPYSDDGVASGTPSPAPDRKAAAGKAVSFDGSTQYYTIANSPDLQVTGSQTISMWVKPASFAARQNPFCKAYGGEGCITQETSGGISYYYGTAGSNNSPYKAFNSATSISLNTWTLITVVRNLTAMTVTFYINGQQDSQASAPYTAATASTLPVYIGNGYAGEYNGSIDDVRLYNRALNPAEVQALYDTYDGGIAVNYGGAGSDGLVGWWKMDGNAKDSSPYGDNGTVSGATATADRRGRAGSAMNFDGVSNYIDLPQIVPSSVSTFSVTAWVKGVSGPSANGNYSYIVHRGANDTIGSSIFWLGVNGSGDYAASVNGNSSNSYGSTGVAADATTWRHLVLTYDGNTEAIYLDGALKFSTAVGGITNSAAGNKLSIGSSSWSSGYRPFQGQIDDVRIYNRALTQDEVTKLYNSYDEPAQLYSSPGGSGSVNLSYGLVGEWDFNGNARDATPYGDNGIVNGATPTTDREGVLDGAYSFDGNTSSITVTDSPILHTAPNFTVSAWIQVASLTNKTGCCAAVIYKDSGATDRNYAVYINRSNGNITGSSSFGGIQSDLAGTSISDGKWHYVAYVVSGTLQQIYVDGSLKNSQTNGATVDSPSVNLFFSPSGAFQGSLDGARIYSRALSADEVQALYNLRD